MILHGHFQNAYVTHNLDKAIEIFSNRFGIEHFDRFDPDMVVKTAAGEQRMCVRVASFWTGSLNIEVIEPVSGYVDHYTSLLPSNRSDAVPRPHHLSFRRDDQASMRADIAKLNLPLAFEGPLSIKTAIPALIFVYLDARSSLGHYLEFTWKSPEGWALVGWPEGRPTI